MVVPVSASRCAGGRRRGRVRRWIKPGWEGSRTAGEGVHSSSFSNPPSVKSVNAGLSCAAATPKPQHYDRTVAPPPREPTARPSSSLSVSSSTRPREPPGNWAAGKGFRQWNDLRTLTENHSQSGPIRGRGRRFLGLILLIKSKETDWRVCNCIDSIKTKIFPNPSTILGKIILKYFLRRKLKSMFGSF